MRCRCGLILARAVIPDPIPSTVETPALAIAAPPCDHNFEEWWIMPVGWTYVTAASGVTSEGLHDRR